MDLPRTALHALHDQAAKLGDRPALWSKRQGTWLPTSWRDHAKRVRHFALGLVKLGLEPGSTVGLMAFNREEWVVANLGAMAVGAVPFGIYITSPPERAQLLLDHARAQVLVVDDVERARRILARRASLPELRHVIVIDPSGGLPEGAVSFSELVARGAAADEKPYWDRVNALQPRDLATLLYHGADSGTPRGVMLSHRNLLWTARKLIDAYRLGEDERLISYLPLAHVAEQLSTIYGPLLMDAAQVFFAGSLDTLGADLREARPTVFFGVPKVWERLMERLDRTLKTTPPPQDRLLTWARRVSTQVHTRQLAGDPVGLLLEGEYALARQLVLERLHAGLGLDRCRHFVTAGAPVSRDVMEFFLSVDIPLRELYGQSEACGPIAVSLEGATQLGRPGRPLLGVEVRISDEGEILVRGESVCLGYLRDPAGTAALIRDGWLHTGDLGELDREGYLRIKGRKREPPELFAEDAERRARSGR